jgi:hypothetical protein
VAVSAYRRGVMVEEPAPDAVEACPDHPSCIRAYKRFASDQLSPLTGWWHLEWDQAASQWNIEDPSGGNRYVVVQQADAPYPPAALTGGMPGLGFEPIVAAIQAQGLFPP